MSAGLKGIIFTIKYKKYKMRKTFIIAALTAAGIVAYLLNRKRPVKRTEPVPRTHHLTKVFAKAKKRAVHE